MAALTTYTLSENAIVHTTQVDFVDRDTFGTPVHLVQGDDKLPVIEVELYKGGQPYVVPASAFGNIRWKKPAPSPYVVIDPLLGVSTDRTKAYIEVTQQMTAQYGPVGAVLELIVSDGTGMSGPLSVYLDRNPVSEDDIEDSNELKTLASYVFDAQTAAVEAEGHEKAAGEHATQAEASAGAAAESAGEAAGSVRAANADRLAAESAKLAAEAAALLAQSWARGETGSRDGEDEDNAKYYAAQALIAALQAAEAAEDAQRVAQGAVGYYKTPELLREKHPSAEDGNWAIVGSTDTIWVWDSDSGDWTNSGNKIDLSQYYTRTEVDDLLTGLEEKMTEDLSAATSKLYTVTVPASGWTAPGSPAPTWQGKTAKWVNTVSVPGMTDTANIPQGCITFTGGSYAAAGQWTWLEQGTDTVTFYSDGAAAPAADFVLRLTEVK